MKTSGLIILVLITNIISAQISESLIVDNKFWQNVETCQWGAEPTINKYFIKINTDTIINTKTYKKVFSSVNADFESLTHIGYIRENSDKVYFKDKTSMNEGLLYDFSLSIGEQVTIENYFLNSSIYTLTVENVDSISINKQNIRRLSFVDSDEYWLEGIGSSYGVLNSGFSDTTGCFYDLICFRSDSVVYVNPEFNDCDLSISTSVFEYSSDSQGCWIYPNPFTDKATLMINDLSSQKYLLKIYSMAGTNIKSDSFFGNEYQINGSQFINGIYFYSVVDYNSNIKYNGKIIKQ